MTSTEVEGYTLAHPPANAETQPVPSRDVGRSQVDPGSLPTQFAVTNLDIDVTEACNLGCLYCFKSEKYASHMTLRTMKRAFEWLTMASGTADRINCNFMGGEPTMRWKEIRQFAVWARRRGRALGKIVTFSMTSNMTLWNDDIREFVDAYGFGILMSVDGCPEVQDAQRPAKNGKKVSAIVEKWAKSMLRTRPGSTGRATLHPDYVHKLYDSVVYLHSIGFQEIAISASEYGDWTPAHLEEMGRQLDRIVDYLVERFEASDVVHLTIMKYFINKLVHARREGREAEIVFQRAPCGAGKGYMMIDYTGDIWPCHRFDGADTDAQAKGQFRLGNIFEAGFNENLQSAFLDFDHSTNHKESCLTCPVNPVCAGYCPAANLSDTGSIYTPHDNYCAITQLFYDKAVMLYDAIVAKGPEQKERLVQQVADAISDGTK